MAGDTRLLTEADALAFYSYATRHDGEPGVYPPTDNGSSGLAAAKALKHVGLITSYKHAFGLEHLLGALMLAPVIIGIPWLENMFKPDVNGLLDVSGDVAGGHELVVKGYDPATDLVTLLNSWSDNWGIAGCASIHTTDLARLLADRGDCTILVP